MGVGKGDFGGVLERDLGGVWGKWGDGLQLPVNMICLVRHLGSDG